MSDTVMLITAFSGLTVAIGALLVSVGAVILMIKIGNYIESMGRGD